MKNKSRKGFTLVELLIVIVVIGILSAMMMLSSTEAVTSSKANNIISNLRNLKTAAIAWHIDSADHFEKGIEKTGTTENEVNDDAAKCKIWEKYLSSGESISNDQYVLYMTASGDFYVKAKLEGIVPSKRERKSVQEKLEKKASSIGLLNKDFTKYNKEDDVYLFAF